MFVAASDNDVIGRDGALPWHLPEDLRRFRELTTGHVVVMGRVTHQSIVDRLGHPLPGRTSIVVSTTLADTGDERVRHATSLPAALRLAEGIAAAAGDKEFFVAGGESIYSEALPSVDRIYLTRIHEVIDGDRAMPAGWLDGFELVDAEPGSDPKAGMRYEFLTYRRAPR